MLRAPARAGAEVAVHLDHLGLALQLVGALGGRQLLLAQALGGQAGGVHQVSHGLTSAELLELLLVPVRDQRVLEGPDVGAVSGIAADHADETLPAPRRAVRQPQGVNPGEVVPVDIEHTASREHVAPVPAQVPDALPDDLAPVALDELERTDVVVQNLIERQVHALSGGLLRLVVQVDVRTLAGGNNRVFRDDGHQLPHRANKQVDPRHKASL